MQSVRQPSSNSSQLPAVQYLYYRLISFNSSVVWRRSAFYCSTKHYFSPSLVRCKATSFSCLVAVCLSIIKTCIKDSALTTNGMWWSSVVSRITGIMSWVGGTLQDCTAIVVFFFFSLRYTQTWEEVYAHRTVKKLKKDKRAFYVPQNSWKEETDKEREKFSFALWRGFWSFIHTHGTQTQVVLIIRDVLKKIMRCYNSQWISATNYSLLFENVWGLMSCNHRSVVKLFNHRLGADILNFVKFIFKMFSSTAWMTLIPTILCIVCMITNKTFQQRRTKDIFETISISLIPFLSTGEHWHVCLLL